MAAATKTGGPTFFILWFGGAVSLAEIMTGSLIAPLGLGKGIATILAGHLIGTLILALVGVIGFREQSPSLKSSRRALGRHGSYLISIFNIVQLIGWTAIMLIQCGRSLQAITGELFGFDNFAVLVLLTGVLVAIWALMADRGINVVNNVAVVLLFGLSIIMLWAVMQGGEMHKAAGSITAGAALELSIVMPLSWVPLISDYTMSGRSAGESFWGSFWGYFLGSSFMYIIGLVSALYTGTPDPVGILAMLGLGLPALLIVILSTVTTTFLDVYSAVMSTWNLKAKISRSRLILAYTALGTGLALFFPMEHYQNFLYMIGSFFAPVFSVVLVDYFLYRADRSGSPFNTEGLVAAACGVFTYYAVLRYDLLTGSTIPAMIVTVIMYALMRFLKDVFAARIRERGARLENCR